MQSYCLVLIHCHDSFEPAAVPHPDASIPMIDRAPHCTQLYCPILVYRLLIHCAPPPLLHSSPLLLHTHDCLVVSPHDAPRLASLPQVGINRTDATEILIKHNFGDRKHMLDISGFSKVTKKSVSFRFCVSYASTEFEKI